MFFIHSINQALFEYIELSGYKIHMFLSIFKLLFIIELQKSVQRL